MNDLASVDYFTEKSILDDPWPWFDMMRAKGPIVREPARGVVVVTGYEEVSEIYARADEFSNIACVGGPIPALPFEPAGDDISEQIDAHRGGFAFCEHFITFDGKKHVAHRQLMTKLLTHSRLKANEAFMHSFADRLIDRFAAQEKCELIHQFSNPMAIMVIADLLGVAEEDRDGLVEMLMPPPGTLGENTHAQTADPLSYLDEAFVRYVKDRQENPRDDMLTDLAQATFPDGSDPQTIEKVRVATFMFVAGQDTSAKLIASGARILAERADLQQHLRESPDRLPLFIEEVLRYELPTKGDFRLCRRTTEVAGVTIRAGEVVMLNLGAANRDPRHFERPLEFDIERPRLRDHVAFGKGPHGCPGKPLARVEAKVGLDRLLARFDSIEIDEEHHGPEGDRHYRYMPSYILRGLTKLHLKLS